MARAKNGSVIGVLFRCFGTQIDGPGLPGGLIIYQGHLFAIKGLLCEVQLPAWDLWFMLEQLVESWLFPPPEEQLALGYGPAARLRSNKPQVCHKWATLWTFAARGIHLQVLMPNVRVSSK